MNGNIEGVFFGLLGLIITIMTVIGLCKKLIISPITSQIDELQDGIKAVREEVIRIQERLKVVEAKRKTISAIFETLDEHTKKLTKLETILARNGLHKSRRRDDD